MSSRARKRYILFMPTTGAKAQWAVRNGFNRIILGRYPMLNKKLIWLGKGLIIKTDTALVLSLKAELPKITVCDVSLRPVLTSGSIKKLKALI